MKSSDFKEALDLFEKNFVGPEEPHRSEFPLLVKKKIYRVFILKKDDLSNGKSVAGVAITATWGQNSAIHIEYVAISDACQGKGLGTILMRSLILHLQNEVKSLDNGPKMLTLECEQKLIGFYSRLGFKLSPTSPRIWKIQENGKQVPHKYFFLGTSLSKTESIADFLDNDNFVRPYKSLLQNKPRDVLKLLRKSRQTTIVNKRRKKDLT
jgi:ribosomal protein S18 acetylase RimI-like enzyme